MKYKKGLIIVLLVSLTILHIPPSMAATSEPINYSKRIVDQSGFNVNVSFTLDITCSANWLLSPGLTDDKLTARLNLKSLELERQGKVLEFEKVIGNTSRQHFKTDTWTTYDNWTGEPLYKWRRESYVCTDGEAFGSIIYSGDITTISPTSLHWTKDSATAAIQTKLALLGTASVKVHVDEYRLRIKISSEAYMDGEFHSKRDGTWSKWFTIGSTPSEYTELKLNYMGVGLFLVIAAIIVVVIIVFLFIAKRKVEIITPIEEETGQLILPIEEEAAPPYIEEEGIKK